MAFIADLWLPIVLSAVFVFIWSSVVHMVLQTHKKDYNQLAGEDEILAAMRAQNVQPGEYMFPYCVNMKDLDTDEMKAKFNQGPVGLINVMPNGMWNIGKSLLQWFAYILLVALVIGYAASQVLDPGTEYMTVFCFVATIAALPHIIGVIPNSIWKGQSWGTTGRFFLDGIVYALLTAGTFAWLWPEA